MDVGAYNLTVEDREERLQLTNQEEWASVVESSMTVV